MHKLEALWIGQRLAVEAVGGVGPLLNLGSSTDHYRRVAQPHVHEQLFAPLIARSCKITHQDIKAAPGVDLVGDLRDPSLVARLADGSWGTVLCCNLLEHMEDRTLLLRALPEMVRPGGRVIITVPCVYPYHADPIDTMWRPDAQELAEQVAPLRADDVEAVSVGRGWRSLPTGAGGVLRMAGRLVFPLWKPRGWWTTVVRLGWVGRRRSILCGLFTRS